MAENVQSGPKPLVDREKAKNTSLARLRQATWEATQFLTYDELREYVEAVLREVETDEP